MYRLGATCLVERVSDQAQVIGFQPWPPNYNVFSKLQILIAAVHSGARGIKAGWYKDSERYKSFFELLCCADLQLHQPNGSQEVEMHCMGLTRSAGGNNCEIMCVQKVNPSFLYMFCRSPCGEGARGWGPLAPAHCHGACTVGKILTLRTNCWV